jgi:hypothetical protein
MMEVLILLSATSTSHCLKLHSNDLPYKTLYLIRVTNQIIPSPAGYFSGKTTFEARFKIQQIPRSRSTNQQMRSHSFFVGSIDREESEIFGSFLVYWSFGLLDRFSNRSSLTKEKRGLKSSIFRTFTGIPPHIQSFDVSGQHT